MVDAPGHFKRVVNHGPRQEGHGMAGRTQPTENTALDSALLAEWQTMIAELALLEADYGPRLHAACDRLLELDRRTSDLHPGVDDIQHAYGFEACSEILERLTPSV
jgi:hypothetical protein